MLGDKKVLHSKVTGGGERQGRQTVSKVKHSSRQKPKKTTAGTHPTQIQVAAGLQGIELGDGVFTGHQWRLFGG